MKKVLFLCMLIGFSSLYAHSGGTNSTGCHVDHSTGIYHCH